MPLIEGLSAEDYKDTPYGRQLVRGFRLLRFEPVLEGEFRELLHQQTRLPQCLGAALLVLLAASYLIFEQALVVIERMPWETELALLRLLQLSVGMVMLLFSFASRRSHARSIWLFPLLLLLAGGVAARFDPQFEQTQWPLTFRYGAGLLIICSFFYQGITCWRALLCAVLVVIADLCLALWLLAPWQLAEHWIAISYCLLLLVIGAVGRYALEYSQREQFLVRRLLAWTAEHDALTGLANRRSFDLALRRSVPQAQREGQPLALLLLDLDDFKAYNDSLGHPAGDALLRVFAELFGHFARRPLDVAARVGGEEFALLLYHCDSAAAELIARRIQRALAERALPHPASGPSGLVTASIGVALLGRDETPDQLYTHADDALYQAKRYGKNRYVLQQGPAAVDQT